MLLLLRKSENWEASVGNDHKLVASDQGAPAGRGGVCVRLKENQWQLCSTLCEVL